VRDDIAILSARVTTSAGEVGTLGAEPSTSLAAGKLELGVGASVEGSRRAG